MKLLAISGWFCCLVMASPWVYVFYRVNVADVVKLIEPDKTIALLEFTASSLVVVISLMLLIISILRRTYD